MSGLRTLILLAGILCCLPASAGAVTIHDIIELTKAGLSDEILVAVIDADRTIFALDKEQILELKRAGVSRTVLLKMIKTRREFDLPPATTTPVTQSGVPVTSTESPQPGIVVIGVEPTPERQPPAPPYNPFYPYYYVPYSIWGTRAPHAPRVPPQPFMPGYKGFGRFINDGWVDRR